MREKRPRKGAEEEQECNGRGERERGGGERLVLLETIKMSGHLRAWQVGSPGSQAVCCNKQSTSSKIPHVEEMRTSSNNNMQCPQ